MTHSPLPWTRGSESTDGWYIFADGTPIARTLPTVDDLEERANASLIAAAPELLAALESMANQTSMDNARQIARAAIARATKGNQ